MKFTNGYWLDREGFTLERGRQVHDIEVREDPARLIAYAPIRPVSSRGDTLNTGLLTVTYEAVAEGVIRVSIEKHRGARRRPPGRDAGSAPAAAGTEERATSPATTTNDDEEA